MITKLREAVQALANETSTLDDLATIQVWANGNSFARGQLKIACKKVGIDGAVLIKEIKANQA